MYKFKNQQRVTFDTGKFKGTGLVVGYSIAEQPVIGASVMINVTESNLSLPTEDYPYTVVSLFETFVDAVN